MYKRFFRLKENPFRLVPNPAYLFLSKCHEEAMGHLVYAISHGDGFVEISGEVGTGKTTLCRALLENLEENIEAAYIFNPKLNSIDLLKTINDEFGINSDPDNTKALIDILNDFLIKKNAEGRKVILIIDEAQNLSKEVLEQVRLISNLETTTQKLIQIILIGQTELNDMLKSPELRQLAQRISLSCYLTPLNRKETEAYIRYRISTAAQKHIDLFDKAAIRVIYKYSKGIPRLINIACERTLLMGYGLNRRQISGAVARLAIEELNAQGNIRGVWFEQGRKKATVMTLLVLTMLLLVLSFTLKEDMALFAKREGGDIGQPWVVTKEMKPEKTTSEPAAVSRPPAGNTKKTVSAKPSPVNVQNPPVNVQKKESLKALQALREFLAQDINTASRQKAVEIALETWNLESKIDPLVIKIRDDLVFLRLAIQQNGLLIAGVDRDLELLRKINLPVILEFTYEERSSPSYLVLSKISDNRITLRGVGETDFLELEPEQIEPYWSGQAHVIWKDFFNDSGLISRGASKDSVMFLKVLLREVGFKHITMNTVYDEKTKKAVKSLQKKYGVPMDGIVGPLTKISLFNEVKLFQMPRLTNPEQENS